MLGKLGSRVGLLAAAGLVLLLAAGPACAATDPQEHVTDKYLFKIGGAAVLTKFMLLELLAAGLILLIFIPLARRLNSGELARGRWDNFWEYILYFVRDEIARPTIGEEEGDRFVPFLLTQFIFILFCNLLGMVPFLGSPSASLWMTGGLAICSLVAIYGAAISRLGLIHFIQITLWPPMEIPALYGLGWLIKALIAVIEFIGVWMKSAVLAIRLFANMFAGHMVLAIFLSFTVVALNAGIVLLSTVTISSVLGVLALSFLELFVACLQAYVFVFLTSLFIGMAMHPH